MLPYPNHQYYLSSQEVPPPPNPTFFTSPTSLDHYGHLFPAEQFNSETLEAVLAPPPAVAAEVAVPLAAVARNGAAGGGAARKRPFRTDRHSKIRTAQGVRDRRMRLSLDVARDFFALQDLLGFDKASKTVDWLLTQSKPAIDRLTGTAQHGGGGADAGMSSPSESAGSKEAAAAGSGGGAQDARGKARARARERTVEKMRGRPTTDGSAFMEHGCELDMLVSSSAPFDQPMDRFQYYYFGEMMDNNGADDDEDGGDEEEGDFFDGMQC